MRHTFQFILISGLGIAGSIIKTIRTLHLLDNGYIIRKLSKRVAFNELKMSKFLKIFKRLHVAYKNEYRKRFSSGRACSSPVYDEEKTVKSIPVALCAVMAGLKNLPVVNLENNAWKLVKRIFGAKGTIAARRGEATVVGKCEKIRE